MVSTLWRPLMGRSWDPFRDAWTEMNRLRRDMDRLFGRMGLGDGIEAPAATYPAMNLWQDEDRLYVEAELPGLNLNDLEIYVSGGNQLTIRGERKPPEVERGTWHRQERLYGSFTRVLTLPCDVQTDQVEARFNNGVLSIELPKCQEAKPRRIAIKSQ